MTGNAIGGAVRRRRPFIPALAAVALPTLQADPETAGVLRESGSEPGSIRVIKVIGDSMAPTLRPGTWVMVDLRDRHPSPPGIFVVWDGLGLVIKRVEFVPCTDPPTVRILSDNAHYRACERALDEAHIQGRVIGGLVRL